ncbi:ANTAR domain-containing response regulator [Natranaerobius thermophilus]|uniref:Stage 0 sporulation protein A homolog n=1 Tax=Natranaerobius thermophilus (strain ATCC BAA-1301 / DSM 18059 / JW/NM-WN-LF) TaxID=457570 RepID=B2A0I6_NATTJ|nr:ANTAR domain-containing protein [Natranaerobius thermophilus]ACB84547.1 response regulator receiver and ANTAR domain protein [Natranaerobius thermophilus JW/NM-WN-LF]
MPEANVVVASGETEYRKHLKSTLMQCGYKLVGESDNMDATLRLYHRLIPRLIIADIDNIDFDVIGLLNVIEPVGETAIVILTSNIQQQLLSMAKESWILTPIMKPVNKQALIAYLEIAMANFERYQKLQSELNNLKDDLETRKLVDRAKNILMKKKKMTEAEAFRSIQKKSMDNSIPMKKVAESIIITNDF